MRHKHADLIIAWANDPSLTIQVKTYEGKWVDVQGSPSWMLDTEYRIKPKVWSPAHGKYHINKPMTEFGMSRPTKEAAERAAKEMRVYHRLLAYRDEFAPGYKVKFPAEMGEASFIYRDSGKYLVGSNSTSNVLGVVYMPRAVAQELARKLNEGEVVL